MIRVFVADDHTLVRSGLRQLLEETADLHFAGEARDGRELLLAAERGEWDVLILDLSLPRLSGLEALHRLRTLRPRLAVVVLSMYPEETYGVRVMREGAAAYLSKDRPSEELLAAIRRVAGGGVYLTETTAGQMLRPKERTAREAHEALSPREHQVFTLLIQGRTPSEIAAELDLSASTVSGHVGKVKEKLGARSIGEIVGYAHRMGLID